MDNELYEKVHLNDGITDSVSRLEGIIEASEWLPSLLVFIMFFTATYGENVYYGTVGILLFIAKLIGFYVSSAIKVMNLCIIKKVTFVFGVLHKYYASYIIVFFFSVLYLNNWVLFVIYLFMEMTPSMFSKRYEKKLSFNTKAAELVIDW